MVGGAGLQGGEVDAAGAGAGLPLTPNAWGGGRATIRAWGRPGTQLASRPQEACERSLAAMESSHQQVMEELQRHHERELQRLQQEKEWLLAEETAATASGEDPGPREPPAAAPRLMLGRTLNKRWGSQCQTWEKGPGGGWSPQNWPLLLIEKGKLRQ